MNSSTIPSQDYTPAPWYVSEAMKRGFNVRSARGGFLAWVATGSDRRDAANAQLIAAAPQLLDYCKLLLDDAARMADDPQDDHQWDWRLTAENLRRLIARAEGTEPLWRRPSTAALHA